MGIVRLSIHPMAVVIVFEAFIFIDVCVIIAFVAFTFIGACVIVVAVAIIQTFRPVAVITVVDVADVGVAVTV